MWIPPHREIEGNKRADELKRAESSLLNEQKLNQNPSVPKQIANTTK